VFPPTAASTHQLQLTVKATTKKGATESVKRYNPLII